MDWSLIKMAMAVVSLLLPTFAVQGASCTTDEVELRVLGSGGPELNDGRFSSSYLVSYQGKAQVLIDAGSGASIAFGDSGSNFNDLAAILLTHLHVDHSVDLPAFVKGSYFTNREHDLVVLGPAGNDLMPSTSSYLESLFADRGAYPYLEEYLSTSEPAEYKLKVTDVPLEKGKTYSYQLTPELEVKARFVHHGPVAAVAWRVNIANCAITFSGDMSNNFDVLAQLAQNSDILVAHNAIPETASKVARNLHLLPSEIGQIAQQAKVKKLVLSHFMNRTLNMQSQTLNLIRKSYQGPIELADDGSVYLLSNKR